MVSLDFLMVYNTYLRSCLMKKTLVQLVVQGLVISHCPSARFIIRTLTASYQLMAASLNRHSQDLVARAVIRGYYY